MTVVEMSTPRLLYKPADVADAMESLGVPKAQRDVFYEAVEAMDAVTRQEAVQAMKEGGLDVDTRKAVMKLLEAGPPPSPASRMPMSPVGAALSPSAPHEAGLKPLSSMTLIVYCTVQYTVVHSSPSSPSAPAAGAPAPYHLF